jgi:hypothetical protein
MSGFTKAQRLEIRSQLMAGYYVNPIAKPPSLEDESGAFIKVLITGSVFEVSDSTLKRLKQWKLKVQGIELTQESKDVVDIWYGDYFAYYRSTESVPLKVDLGDGRFFNANIYIHAIPKFLKRLGFGIVYEHSGDLVKATPVNNDILEVIHELFGACGPQSFSQILHEVRTQCRGVSELEEAHRQVKAHIAYWVSLRSVIEQSDEFGIVYGHPADF